MPFDQLKPYNDLPLLAFSAELETPTNLKNVIQASRALAKLNGVVKLFSN